MGGGGKKMLKRYKMYYNEAVGKIEMTGEPDYGVGDFRIAKVRRRGCAVL